MHTLRSKKERYERSEHPARETKTNEMRETREHIVTAHNKGKQNKCTMRRETHTILEERTTHAHQEEREHTERVIHITGEHNKPESGRHVSVFNVVYQYTLYNNNNNAYLKSNIQTSSMDCTYKLVKH